MPTLVLLYVVLLVWIVSAAAKSGEREKGVKEYKERLARREKWHRVRGYCQDPDCPEHGPRRTEGGSVTTGFLTLILVLILLAFGGAMFFAAKAGFFSPGRINLGGGQLPDGRVSDLRIKGEVADGVITGTVEYDCPTVKCDPVIEGGRIMTVTGEAIAWNYRLELGGFNPFQFVRKSIESPRPTRPEVFYATLHYRFSVPVMGRAK